MGLNASADRSNSEEPASGNPSGNPEGSGPDATGRSCVIAMDADELFERIAGLPSNTIQDETLCLAVDDWDKDEPSIYLITDDGTPLDNIFEDSLHPTGHHLEFRFKFPLDYPGGRPGFLGCTRDFLWSKTALGITCIYLGQSADAYLKAIKKSVSKKNRPRFSQAVSAFGTQVSWAQDVSKPNIINFRVRIDKEEAALIIVDSESKAYKEELGSDKQKFINAAILPLRILLRVTWWKDHLRTSAVRMAIEKRLQQGPAGSESTNPEDQWWWPIVLEEQRKARARGAATGAAMATGRSVSADNDPTDHNMSAEAKQPSSQPPSDQPPSEQVASEQPSEQPSSEQPPSDTSETAKNDLNTPEVPQQLVSCPITSSKSKKKAKKNRKKRKNTTTPQQMDSCNTDSTAEQPFTVISEAQSSASATDPSSITLAGRDIPPADLTSTPTLPSNDDDNTQSKDMSLASKDTLSEQNDSPSLEPPSATCVAPENRPEIMDTVSVTDSLSPSSTPIPLPSPRATSRPPDKSHESTESLEVTPLTESYTHLQLAPVNTNLPSEISPAPHQLSGTDTLASDDEGAGNLGDNHKRRADAIRLIRARTLSRLSPAEESAATELPTPHSEGSSYHQESTDLDQTPSEKAGMSTSKKKNKKKKQKQKQKEKHISDQPSASPSGNETTHHPSGLLPQDATSIASTDTAAEQDLSSQVSPTESVPKETTQVAISHPSLIQPFPMTLKSEERPRRQDRKSCLDPLALEYIPNYQSGDGFLSRPKGSPSTSSSDASEWKQRLGIEISARESRDITKDEGNIASSETTKYQKTTESTSDSPTTLAPSAYSYQRLSTNDTDFSLSLSSSNDQLTTASAFQEKESSKIQDDGTISASRTTDTDHNTTQRTPTAISEIGTDLQTVHSPTIRYPVEERRVVTSQSLILSTEPSLSRRASRTSIRDRLSPIHESPVEMVADEKAVRDSPQPYDQDIRSATEHSHPYLPDTGSTESIAHIAQEFSIETRGNQETRQVELTTPEAVQDHQGIVTSSSAASSNFASSHAHPSPSSTHSGQGASTIQRPQGFFWQLDSHGFPCAKADCDKRCNSWDGASVICPRCGPFSEVRYCGPEHLYADIKQHWAFCGQMTFRHPCRENTIPREQREGPPLLPSRHQWDTPERHRQAVYHSTNRDGDYFIFADWAEFVAAGQPANNVAVRCSNRVLCVVKFDGAAEKDRFHRVLGVCLFASIEVVNLVDYLFRLIRDNLRTRGEWSGELDTALRYQIQHELAVALPPGITGQRHACETEWDGRNARHCTDPVCTAERRPLLGDLGMGRGFRRLCDYMESSHWLLRAARITHPTIAQVAARTRGEGFDEVLEEDRRLFRRGEGWDGAGSGEMEIEGVNV